ncbi:hypothetical protein K3495_g12752 [Podosphaera aphanis]|nr:hypothetical protein K3495_g12752 [Podosphaera aphanis]
MDDVLIYSDGSRHDHLVKVRHVLERLGRSGLKLDIDKCEFAVHEIKYLGFVITAGEGIKVDPGKIEAIKAWEPPTNVKGVRSFVGFANFYREFIENFSQIAAPLVALTHKDQPWRWDELQQTSFERLKELFITAPVLAHWNPDRSTVVEADCSGYSMGACLSQLDSKGRLRPIAYFSKKLSPAESNYEIHDKELLAIVKALEEWRSELNGVTKPFTILSDHKNLQHFMTTRKLSERQVRWSLLLSQYRFQLKFRAGSKSQRPDALSRREQDMPNLHDDERLKNREMQLLKDEWMPPKQGVDRKAAHVLNNLTNTAQPKVVACSFEGIPLGQKIFEEVDLQKLWDKGIKVDKSLKMLYEAACTDQRSFPPGCADWKLSKAECELDSRGALKFRERLIIPTWEPLQTALIQRAHDSHITGQPGRDSTFAILRRDFHWPGMSQMVRRFCRNCDVCGRCHLWREKRKGLLKPLPVPERFYGELSIDFMTELPQKTSEDPRYLMVICDRLLKSMTLEAMTTMDADRCAETFVQCHFRFHGFPKFITSDRGSNWTSDFWTRLCQLVKIERRLSTAFHPETDGTTERANQEVQAYLRAFVTYAQYDWPKLLPMAMPAINNRENSTRISPFFLTHGYHVEPIQQVEPKQGSRSSRRAEIFVDRLREGQDFAQAAMAVSQQRMEDSANKHRQTAIMFKVVELDVPSNIHPRFHVDLLKIANTDPLPSQLRDDSQPPPTAESGAPEHFVQKICRSRSKKVGRGFQRQVLVKWEGYRDLSWEPREEFENTVALDLFEQKFGIGDDVGEENTGPTTGPKPRLNKPVTSDITHPSGKICRKSKRLKEKSVQKDSIKFGFIQATIERRGIM